MIMGRATCERMENMDIVNERFRKFREMLGVSVKELAEKTKIKPQRIRDIERGKVKVRTGDVTALMDVYGISADYLVGSDMMPHPIFKDRKEAAFWKGMSQLPKEELAKVVQAIEEHAGAS